MTDHVNTKYPNLPADFIVEMKKARLEQGWATRAVSAILGLSAATISQYETGKRNMSYERAVQLRDLYEMDFYLPEPDFTDAPTVTRKRTRYERQNDPFFIVVDGELIKVLTYFKMGPVSTAVVV
jgi:transcriptional regulator with XRE-family HTH domain